MTIFTLSDIFNGQQEQEVMDEVVLWEGDATHGNQITLSQPYTNFEYIYVHSGFYSGADFHNIAAGYLDKNTLDNAGTFNISIGQRSEDSNYASNHVYKLSPNTFGVSVYNSTAWRGRVVRVVGFKRRIARVGLDELMSSMGMPNLVTNPDLNNPVNQRAFNGNWGSLAIGSYGYDQWIKVSDTHMGFVIEDGKYIPNKMHTLTVNNAVIKQVMSPASGHFVVAIPFATSGVYDFYAGEFKRPWHPSFSPEGDCMRYYERSANPQFMWPIRGGAPTDDTQARCTLRFTQVMRIVPTLTGDVRLDNSSSGGTVILAAFQLASKTQCVVYPHNDRRPDSYATLDNWTADASIPWSELDDNVITAI